MSCDFFLLQFKLKWFKINELLITDITGFFGEDIARRISRVDKMRRYGKSDFLGLWCKSPSCGLFFVCMQWSEVMDNHDKSTMN